MVVQVTLDLNLGHRIIPPGPFLDELKKNGLVDCKPEWTWDNRTVIALTPPEKICL